MLMAKSIEAEHINLDSWGKPLTYKTATSGQKADKWRKALCEELIRLTEETGTGVLVFNTSPTLVTPI